MDVEYKSSWMSYITFFELSIDFSVDSAANSKDPWANKKEPHPSEYVMKAGKSKFYQRSTDELDKITDDELEYDDPKTVETDAQSQTSIETAETLPAKEPLD